MESRRKHLKNLNHQAKIKRLRRLLATGTAVAALATVGFNKTQVHADEIQKDAVKQRTPEPVGDGTAPATQKTAAASSASSDSQASSSSAALSSSESSADKATMIVLRLIKVHHRHQARWQSLFLVFIYFRENVFFHVSQAVRNWPFSWLEVDNHVV